jgi:predicted SnoaL-like aldol condensation-catalyzing enzyme
MIVPGRIARGLALAALLLAAASGAHANQALTERNKAVVRAFYTTVFLRRNIDAAPRFVRADYLQHNPQVPTGLKGLMDTFRPIFAKPTPPGYKRELLNVVGDNEIVVIYVRQSWTAPDGAHRQALGFDMFRVKGGMITEHWDADN